MKAHTHWIYENFYAGVDAMRERIELQFNEKYCLTRPFEKRAIWNYWYINKLYIYLRTPSHTMFEELLPPFMKYMRHFAAAQYGMRVPANPMMSMYINGCGQGQHNDAKNGRLAYVFSLTHWKERHFEGGETIIHKFQDQVSLNPGAGTTFYSMVEPVFNRLLVFDDRAPHAVRFIQGTMQPLDARFVMHGHMEEPGKIGYIEGGLEKQDLQPQWEQMNDAVSKLLQENNQHGFITIETLVDPQGLSKSSVKHAQLLPMKNNTEDIQPYLDKALEIVSGVHWPKSEHYSKLVFALCSHPLKQDF